jgi:hypothetical protein
LKNKLLELEHIMKLNDSSSSTRIQKKLNELSLNIQYSTWFDYNPTHLTSFILTSFFFLSKKKKKGNFT